MQIAANSALWSQARFAVVLAIGTALIASTRTDGETLVCGTLDTPAALHWTVSGSPYRLTCDVTVPAYEPFNDWGHDGVPGTFDEGEGNGEWDLGEPFTDYNGNGSYDDPLWLTIDPGVQVSTNNSSNQLHIYGALAATGVTFYGGTSSGMGVRTYAHNGAQVDLTDCTYTGTGAGWVEYYAGSSGTVDHCVGNCGLKVASAAVTVTNGSDLSGVDVWASASILNSTIDYFNLYSGTPTIQGNTLTDAYPFRVEDPDVGLGGISGNTYTAGDPKITIWGTLEGIRTLGFVDELGKYYVIGTLNVNAGAGLMIAPGVQVSTNNSSNQLHIYGALAATGVTFYGGTSSGMGVRTYAHNGAQVDLTDCTYTGTGAGWVEYYAGSSGTVVCCVLDTLSVNYIASVFVASNDLSGGAVSVSGAAGAPINMEQNWWGSTDPNQIAARITDCNDNPSLPCVNFEPFLNGPPDGCHMTPHQTRSAEYVGAWELHQVGIRGAGVTIGIADFSLPQPHLALFPPRLLPPVGVNEGSSDPDDMAHVLMVAGLAAGYIADSSVDPPHTPYVAMAPYSRVLPTALDLHPHLPWGLMQWTDEFQALYDGGSDVVSCSVGDSHNVAGAIDLESFLDQMVETGNVVVVVAVGDTNTPSQLTAPASPANAYNVIAVGALRDHNQNWGSATEPVRYDLLDSYSVIGPGRGRCKPDLVAPGDSCWPIIQNGNELLSPDRGETSAAAPHVAGAVALLIDAYRSAHGSSPAAHLVKSVLLNSAYKRIEVPAGVGDPPSQEPRWWQTSGTTQPLDYALGAGGLDVSEARRLLMEEDDAATTRRIAVDSVNWTSNPNATALLCSVPLPRKLVATLTWNAHYNGVFEGSQINNLSLVLLRDGIEVARSDSILDNVQHIWTTVTPGGEYSLSVSFVAHEPGIAETESFALAYTIKPFTPGDLDGDEDVDFDDFAQFSSCISGPNAAHPIDCDYADMDSDSDVDLLDFAAFQGHFGQ